MQRDRLLVAEMIHSAARVIELVGGRSAGDLDADDLPAFMEQLAAIEESLPEA